MSAPTPFPALTAAMSEREQRILLADYFAAERVRLGLPGDDAFATLLGELRTGVLCAPASPRETCRFCGKRLKWDSDVSRVRCEKACTGHLDGAPSVEEFQAMVAAGVPATSEVVDSLRTLVAHGCGCHLYGKCPHAAAVKLIARYDAGAAAPPPGRREG